MRILSWVLLALFIAAIIGGCTKQQGDKTVEQKIPVQVSDEPSEADTLNEVDNSLVTDNSDVEIGEMV